MTKNDAKKAEDFNHFIKWQSEQLDLEFSLVEQADQPLRDGFFALAVATYKALHAPCNDDNPDARRRYDTYSIAPNSADNFVLRRWLHPLVPADILQNWINWKNDYPAFIARNPRLELCDMMVDISESHDACSWPWEYENKIRDWVDSGKMEPAPFEDRAGLLKDDKFFNRLCELRAKIKGWPKKVWNANQTDFCYIWE